MEVPWLCFSVDVQLEAALLHGGENGGPGLLADVGVVVEHPGHGAHGIAGLGGKIFDRHNGHLPLRKQYNLETIPKPSVSV